MAGPGKKRPVCITMTLEQVEANAAAIDAILPSLELVAEHAEDPEARALAEEQLFHVRNTKMDYDALLFKCEHPGYTVSHVH